MQRVSSPTSSQGKIGKQDAQVKPLGTTGMEALVPDVLPKLAQQACVVSYGGGADVLMGNKLTVKQTESAPVAISFKAPANTYCTVLMIDPDAPSRTAPRLRHWRHWLVVNVPNSCDVREGNTVTPYAGPTPPVASGPHRYAFLVYPQRARLTEKEAKVQDARGGFKLAHLVEDFKLGDALAANFFLCERR